MKKPKKAAKKSAKKAAAPKKKAAVKAANPDAALLAFAAEREAAPVDVEVAIAEALNKSTDLVSVVIDASGNAIFTPFDLFTLKFSSPKVGLDDGQMGDFLRNLSALFDSKIGTRILTEIPAVASQSIRTVTDLILLWKANPDV